MQCDGQLKGFGPRGTVLTKASSSPAEILGDHDATALKASFWCNWGGVEADWRHCELQREFLNSLEWVMFVKCKSRSGLTC